MMTNTEQEAFFRFKMKVLPLTLKVFLARGDYVPEESIRPLRSGDVVFDADGKLHQVVDEPCEGIEIEPGVFSGCAGTHGDCPECDK